MPVTSRVAHQSNSTSRSPTKRGVVPASVDPKTLYPSKAEVLFWAGIAAVRTAIVCSIAVCILHPLVISFANAFSLSEFATFMILMPGTHGIVVGAYVAFFMACDANGWFKQYKLPRSSKSRNQPGLTSKALLHLFLYHCVVGMAEVLVLWRLAPHQSLDQPLPAFDWLLNHFFKCYVGGEIFMYVLHYAQHRLSTLAYYHKVHHQYIECDVLAAEYSSFVELTFGVFVGYMTNCPHVMTIHLVTVIWRVASNQEVHSGYSFRGTLLSRLGFLHAYQAEFHDFHHLHPEKNESYGKPPYMDYLMGTCDSFLLHCHAQGKKALYW